jgi:O-6-methylguanine DNA methyltransferase
MELLHYRCFNSPYGPITVGVSRIGLAVLEFGDHPPNKLQGKQVQWNESVAATELYVRQLQRYFAGQLQRFTLPLDLRGTPFQKSCWQALLQIPYGETRSYAELARAVGKPTAFRAVGMANHSNPVPIVVPCHRVITSDGKLGGYGGGLTMKQELLKLEGATVNKQNPVGAPHLPFSADVGL